MDRLTRTVREQVALGRLLPLGGPQDPAWIAERAAAGVLRRAAAALPGVRLGEVAVVLAGGPAGEAPAPGDAAPVGALPHGPLRVEADFEATPGEPLPTAADRLRDALWASAREGLGLAVEAVDLRVTGLLDPGAEARERASGSGPGPGPGPGEAEGLPGEDFAAVDVLAADGLFVEGPAVDGPAVDLTGAVAAAVLAVPGVLGLTRRLAGIGSGVRVRDTDGADGPGDAARAPELPDPPGRRVQVQIAVAAGLPVLTVARAVAAAVTAAAGPGAPGPVTTAVLVTDVG